MFAGDFLEGLEIDRSPQFHGWLVAQRRRFRGCQTAAAGASGRERVGRRGIRLSGAVARACSIRSARPRAPAECTWPRRPHTRGRGAPGGDDPVIRGGRARQRADPRRVAVRESPPGAFCAACRGRLHRGPDPAACPGLAREQPRRDRHRIAPPRLRCDHAVCRPGRRKGRASAGSPTRSPTTSSSGSPSCAASSSSRKGTVFALHDRSIGSEEAGRTLNVDYVVSGSMQRHDRRLSVTVELAETRSARIVWTEVFDHKLDDAFLVLDEIGNRIVASIASEIETVERNRAILKPPSSLDAWEAHHRGLWHMYRFNRRRQRPGPALSSRWRFASIRPSRAPSPACPSRTSRTPSRAGPGASWKWSGPSTRPGKASWSTTATRRRTGPWGGRFGCAASQDQSVIELERAIDLSPNFALGHYALAFVHSQGGDPRAALGFADHSRQLSPFDPDAVRHARRARYGIGPARDSSMKPPTGPSRPPLARTRMRISGRSRPAAWRWPIGATRRRPSSARSTRPFRSTASTISWPHSASVRMEPPSSAKAQSASAFDDLPARGGRRSAYCCCWPLAVATRAETGLRRIRSSIRARSFWNSAICRPASARSRGTWIDIGST